MDELKLRRLVDGPKIDPSEVRALAESEVRALRSRLCDRLGLGPVVDDQTLAQELEKRRRVIEGCNAEAGGFDVMTCLAHVGVMPSACVYVNWFNWYGFKRADQVRFELFRRCLDDFWYPAADDPVFLDEGLAWIMMIDHEGHVWFIDLKQRELP